MFSDNLNEIVDKLQLWGEEAIRMLPNLALAIIILIAFNYLSKWARRGTNSVLDRLSSHKEINKLLSTVVRLLVLVAGLFFALGVLDLDKTVTSLLAGVGIIGLALGFAFQDIASNFMSGIMLSIRTPFKVGDIIRTSDFEGTVRRIDLRITELQLFTGEHVLIPNKDVLQNPITNYNIAGIRRIDLECGISYGDDLDKVKKIALEAINSAEHTINESETTVLFNSFGDSSINFTARYWVKFDTKKNDYLIGIDSGVRALKKAFDDNDIMIPFPIRTLDFGIKGGEKLDEVMDINKLKEK